MSTKTLRNETLNPQVSKAPATRSSHPGQKPMGRTQLDRFLKLAAEDQADQKVLSQEENTIFTSEQDQSISPRSEEGALPKNRKPTPSTAQELLQPYQRQRSTIKMEDLQRSQAPLEAPKPKEIQLPQFSSPHRPGQAVPQSASGKAVARSGQTTSPKLAPPAKPRSEQKAELSPSPHPQTSPEALHQQLSGGLQHLEAQVQHVNQLSANLEMAMIELRSLSVTVSRLRQALESGEDMSSGQPPNVLEGSSVNLPYIKQHRDGRLKLASKRVDLLQAERDAASTAQFLRNRRTGQPSVKRPASASPLRPSKPRTGAASTGKTAPTHPVEQPSRKQAPRRYSRWFRSLLCPPRSFPALITDAALWIAVAGGLRLGLQVILSANPSLWPPIVLLLVTPVIIATYQITLMARSGRILGYRLLLILIGLVLGGRL
ncbi:hypothetical protein BST81_07965 [Leptolyngbya sp. 'hensonii']|uniref:hypothetical protein n=1 Tax=Leptolyngbya sp. 'hensonii' TaxID=1922337 RepID=UPI000965901F|nr:hypothetical protein [Leptolyngbya sp. 'hensonii']OLP18845.1 hypothetical protein BST81_07965 [Leptolyngbya sp. 'hensonii']